MSIKKLPAIELRWRKTFPRKCGNFEGETDLSGDLGGGADLRRSVALEHSAVGQEPEFSMDISLLQILPPVRGLGGCQFSSAPSIECGLAGATSDDIREYGAIGRAL